jgi:excisionase family DNA binding protein
MVMTRYDDDVTYEEFLNLPNEALLKPNEVADAFRVDPKTVTRWSKTGKLEAIRTIGGHRRFRKLDVMRAMDAAEVDAAWQGIR